MAKESKGPHTEEHNSKEGTRGTRSSGNIEYLNLAKVATQLCQLARKLEAARSTICHNKVKIACLSIYRLELNILVEEALNRTNVVEVCQNVLVIHKMNAFEERNC